MIKIENLPITTGRLAVIKLLVCGLLLVSGGNLFAQKAQTTDNKADGNLKSAARVNPSTRAMEFSLPLGGYPGRGGSSMPIVLNYSSKLWDLERFQVRSQRAHLVNDQYEVRQSTDIHAIFSKKAIAGWTSSLQPPAIIEQEELYNQFGDALNLGTIFNNDFKSFGDKTGDNLFGDATWTCEIRESYSAPAGNCSSGWATYYVEVCSSPGTIGIEQTVSVLSNTCSLSPYPQSPGNPNPNPGPNPVTGLIPEVTNQVKRVRVQMPDGSSHEFRKNDTVYDCSRSNSDCEGSKDGTYLSVDGSRLRLERGEVQTLPDTGKRDVLYLPDGSRYIFPAPAPLAQGYLLAEKFVDVNGNFSAYNSATGQWMDTMARPVTDPLPNPLVTNFAPSEPQSVVLKGIDNQDLTYQIVWKSLADVLESSSTQLKYIGADTCQDIMMHPVDGSSLFTNQPGDPDTSGDGNSQNTTFIRNQRVCANSSGTAQVFNPWVMAELVQPDGSRYKFKYNEYAEMTKITYPTGGYEHFEYETVPPLGYAALEVYSQGNRGVKKRQVSFDGTTVEQTWLYDSNGAITMKAPDGSRSERDLNGSTASSFGFENPLAGMPNEERTYDKSPNHQLRSRTLTEWTTTAPQGTGAFADAQRDPRPISQISIIFENGQALATLSETEYETPDDITVPSDPKYFARLNVKQVKSYHYLPLNPATAETGTLATIKNAFHTSGQVSAISQTDYQYDAAHLERGFPSLPVETRSLNPANPTDVLAKSRMIYDEPGQYYSLDKTDTTNVVGYALPTRGNSDLRGNATTTQTWVKETGGWLSTHARYDTFGNLRKAWDISGDQDKFTETQYSSAYNYAYPTKVTAPAPNAGNIADFGTTATSSIETTYDPTTGLPLSVTNDAGQITKTAYDALSRPWRVYAHNYTAPETQTIHGNPDPQTGQYSAGERFVKVRKQIDANNWDEATTWMDGMGRTIKTQSKDAAGDVFVETQYDEMGRAVMTTNPYRAGETKLWNLTEFDAAGRVKQSRAPVANQNPNQPTGDILGTTSYDLSTAANFVGTVVTSADASQRKSRSFTNALGQLLRVDEPDSENALEAITQTSPTPAPTVTPTPTPTPGPTVTPTPGPTPSPTPGGGGCGSVAIDPGNPCLAGSQYPMYSTVYTYDAYGKMVKVQQGSQSRYFKYDSLGRLLRVKQPEQQTNGSLNLADAYNTSGEWTAGFTYDYYGNVLTAVDARGVTMTNTYDRANRLLTKTYSGESNGQTTPPVYFTYDGVYYSSSNNRMQATGLSKGSLTQVRNGISTSQTIEYDTLGRAKKYQQITDGTTYTSEYTYDSLSGALIEEKYPDGRVVKNEFNSNGDLARVFGKANAAASEKTYVNSLSYTAAGGINQMRLGNGRWETAKFNTRLQMTELGLGNSGTDASLWKVAFEYGELNDAGTDVNQTKNTGNIARQTISFAGLTNPFVQSFRYDSLYRLTAASETNVNATQANWTQNFAYDRFGNRTAFAQNLSGIPTTDTPTIDAATNRFVETADLGYDKNGNIIKDKFGSQKRQFTFNGENKQTEIRDTNLGVSTQDPDANLIGRYSYDGEGKRVKKETNTETTIFVYSGGKLIQEYSTKLADQPSINFTTSDHLGTPRIITDELGAVKARRDFMPFGEELLAGVGGRTSDTGQKYSATKDEVRQKFTGYQKDTETQLDFAEARMYNNAHGRFTAVDPLLASGKSANPQSFNRYVYVRNQPLALSDPSGKCPPQDNNPCGGVEDDPVPLNIFTVWIQSLGKYADQANNYLNYSYGVDPDKEIKETWGPTGPAIKWVNKENPSGKAIEAFNGGMSKVEPYIRNTPVLGAYTNAFMTGRDNDLGSGSFSNVVLSSAQIPLDFASFMPAGTGEKVLQEGAEISADAVSKGIFNKGGQFSVLDAEKVAGEVGHHMPQNAFTTSVLGLSRGKGPALGMTTVDHALTRTFSGRGAQTMRLDAAFTARERLFLDILDIRRNFGTKYNQGLLETIEYSKTLSGFAK